MAPPKLCPVNITLYSEYSFIAAVSFPDSSSATACHASQNPLCALHPLHRSTLSSGKSMLAIQFSKVREPRNDTTSSLFVSSAARKPVTSP